jgi:hypothetical protein
MEIEWITNDVIDKVRPGSESSQIPVLEAMLVELKKNPGSWAKFPELVNSQPVVHRWKTLFPGLQFKATGGNGLRTNDPAKKKWTLYVRYVDND